MVDSLQIGAAVIVVFVLALATEILFACCRVYNWLRRQVSRDPGIVPPGRYRRGSVSHTWSETTVSENSTSVGASPERLYTPVDELLSSASAERQQQVLGASAASAVSLHDDGPYSATNIYSAYSDTLQVAEQRERKRSPGLRQHKLLFSTDFTQSLQQDWQSGQFSCRRCGSSLVAQRYILRDDQPYCKKCYEELFSNTCVACKTRITTDYKDLSYRDKHWHDMCFKCGSCSTSLINESFAFKNDQLCCAHCYEQMFAPRCTKCKQVFRPGTKKYEHRGRQWHAECFVCMVCQQQIGTNSFIPRANDIVCVPCYERQYSQSCTKCGLPIGKGGIVYNNCPWHRDCFCCSHCHRVLGRERFTSVDNQPYCVDCYGQQFAKKCCTCTKPITGVDGAKFIAFEGRQWHADCFICYKCRALLFGRGFLTDGDDILCPDCCKED